MSRDKQHKVSRQSFKSAMEDTTTIIKKFNSLAPKSQRKFLFINDKIDEAGEADSEDTLAKTTTASCNDYINFGRCLGNHADKLQSVNETFSSKFKISDRDFNQTLNSSMMKFKPDLSQNLSRMPKWATQVYLNALPIRCSESQVSLYKEPVGNQLANLINESIREIESRDPLAHSSMPTATSIPQGPVVTPPNEEKDDDTASSLCSVPIVKPGFHTMRVRIQNSSLSSNAGSSYAYNVADSSNPALEHWSVIPNEDNVHVKGRNIRTRKNVVTDPIKRCISPRTLECTDGIVYHLIGSVNNDNNELPEAIAKNFSMGFPPKWKNLVKNWSNQIKKDNQAKKAKKVPQNAKVSSTTRKNLDSDSSELSDSESENWLRPNTKKRRTSTPNNDGRNEELDSSEYELYNTVLNRSLTNVLGPKANTSMISVRLTGHKRTVEPIVQSTSDSEDSDTGARGRSRKPMALPKKTNILLQLKPGTSTQHEQGTHSHSDEKEKNRKIDSQPLSNCSVVLRKLDCEDRGHSFKRPENTVKTDCKNLVKWRPVLGNSEDKVQVIGCVTDSKGNIIEENHVTAFIIQAKEKIIQVEKGMKYTLEGPAYFSSTVNGLPPVPDEIKKYFSNGFPFQWASYIKKWHESIANTVKKEKSQPTRRRGNTKADGTNTKRVLEVSPVLLRSEDLAGIKVLKSSRGRRIVQPLKYWENERLMVHGTKLLCKGKSATQVLSPPLQNKTNATVKVTRASPRLKVTQKRVRQDTPTSTPVKKPRKNIVTKAVVQKQTKKKVTVPNNAQKTRQKKTEDHKVAEKNVPTNSKAETKTSKATSEKPHFEKEEIMELMTQPVKTARQRQKREKVLLQMQKENAHTDKDFFTSGCSGLSSDEDLSETLWDADSVSSKLTTSDDDRMNYNYTPPGMRMGKLVLKSTPSPLKHGNAALSPAGKPRDQRTIGFIHRQLMKPKNLLTKKQRDVQKAAAENAALLLKYRKSGTACNSQESELANKLYKHITDGDIVDPDVMDFLKKKTSQEDGGSSSEVEKYYTDEED